MKFRCSKCGLTFEEGCRRVHKQRVNRGKLASGQAGLFTGGFLVMTLTPEQDNEVEAKKYAERLGFEYVD